MRVFVGIIVYLKLLHTGFRALVAAKNDFLLKI